MEENQLLKGGNVILPNSSAILVMGILSIACICCGPFMLLGFVMGILAIVMGGKAMKLYGQNPELYTMVSYKNTKSGRICGIIGVCLSGVWLLFAIFVYIFVGVATTCAIFSEIFG